jgi:hypothetical protein
MGRSAVAIGGALALACTTVLEPRLHSVAPPATEKSQPLKVHMRSGELYVMRSWRLLDEGRVLAGPGRRYTVGRVADQPAEHRLAVAEIALLESNDPHTAASAAALGLGTLTVFFGALSGICLADPKSCFGSCPTFYVDGDRERPRAEGFSSSIARALEATDVDALGPVRARGGRLALVMRNEALETQAVQRLRVLALPRPGGAPVFASADGRFHAAAELKRPRSCRGEEGSCLAAVARLDGRERVSAADGADLAARETVELHFPPSRGRVGLVLGARQGLVTTFVFYQALAALGSRAGEFLAALERGGPRVAERAMAMARALGEVEVEVAEGEEPWRTVGRYDEAGPIAADVKVIPFQATGAGPLRVRLRLARGNWRLDWVALARLGDPVAPLALEPIAVERSGRADPLALAALRDDERYLVTQPGDAYRITFEVPRRLEQAEFFLESRGYYYEWQRAEWLAEEDAALAALIFEQPAAALRRLAAPYKMREASAERTFWNSRFRRMQ